MKGGTLFSGIGAPECAMPAIDWRWAAEIDPFACAVHKARFPGVPNLGDVARLTADAIEPVDLIVFGSPCQSFSVAGKRLGLDDPRGNMALVGLRVVGRVRPRWMVWENVPGVLSSDEGRDFGTFLGLLGELGYGFAYRILDAQHFGVPQRRRRVFVVGHLGDWRPAAAVLFEPESLRGDTAPRREAGKRIALPVASCIEGGSGYRNDADRADDLIAFSAKDHGADAGEIAPTLRAMEFGETWANGGGQVAVAFGGNRQSGPLDVAIGVNAHGGPYGRLDFESETFVCGTLGADNARHPAGAKNESDLLVTHSLRADGFDASEDGTGRGTPLIPILEVGKGSSSRGAGPNGAGFGKDGDPMFTLQSGAQHAIGGGMTVRRLTPRECERLQGFSDDYTLVPYRGKPAADGPRYRAIGNSMAVPVMGWILDRIRAAEIINELAVIRLANSAFAG